jgi:hypothetical protein
MEPMNERRRHPRFFVDNDILAVLKPFPVKLGQIINISQTGIAFQYQGSEKLPDHYSHIDLFITKDIHDYTALPIRLIRETTLPRIKDNILPIRQAAMEFKDLTEDQIIRVRDFITAHAGCLA